MSSRPHQNRAFLLDFDGTLADSLGAMAVAYRAFAAHFGFRPSDDEFAGLNGPPLAVIVESLRHTHGLSVGQAEAMRAYEQEIERAIAAVGHSHGARTAISAARDAGWRVGVVTSNHRDRVAAWLERQCLIVDDIVGGETTPGKPNPTPYLVALDRLGCAANASLAVEDSAQGYAAAVGASLRTLFYRPLDRREAPAGTETIETLAALVPVLRGERRPLQMRLANVDDLPFLYALRNDPVAAMHSRTPRTLSLEELEQRFRPDPMLARKITMVAECDGSPAGMVRFDRSGDQFLVSIALAAAFRGCGLGAACLRAGIDALFAMRGPQDLRAEVAEANHASDRIFRANEFMLGEGGGRFRQYHRPRDIDDA